MNDPGSDMFLNDGELPRLMRPGKHGNGTVLERRFMLSMAVVILALMGPAVVIVQIRAAEHFQTSARARGASMATLSERSIRPRGWNTLRTVRLRSASPEQLPHASAGATRKDAIRKPRTSASAEA